MARDSHRNMADKSQMNESTVSLRDREYAGYDILISGSNNRLKIYL